MVYPAISSRRMPYDIDGTEILSMLTSGLGQVWLTAQEKSDLNKETQVGSIGTEHGRMRYVVLFFPELREVTHLHGYRSHNYLHLAGVEGSTDTTNGIDGTWMPAVLTGLGGTWFVANNAFSWRSDPVSVSLPSAVKAIRLTANNSAGSATYAVTQLHVYGYKAATETPDDLLFVNASTGAEKTALMDWGDRQEGTTLIDSLKVKNASASKIANDINLQLNHADFFMSWSADGPWTATLDIATLGIGALSNTIYIRNKLEPPLLLLGPYAARVIASVGSWT